MSSINFQPCRRPLTAFEWSEIERDYLAGKSMSLIAKEFKERGVRISNQAISKRAKAKNWGDPMPDMQITQAKDEKVIPGPVVEADPAPIAAPVPRSRQLASAILRQVQKDGVSAINAGAELGMNTPDFNAWVKSDPTFEQEI